MSKRVHRRVSRRITEVPKQNIRGTTARSLAVQEIPDLDGPKSPAHAHLSNALLPWRFQRRKYGHERCVPRLENLTSKDTRIAAETIPEQLPVGRQTFRYTPERPTTGKVRVARNPGANRIPSNKATSFQ
jgi:hypothetical protein